MSVCVCVLFFGFVVFFVSCFWFVVVFARGGEPSQRPAVQMPERRKLLTNGPWV